MRGGPPSAACNVEWAQIKGDVWIILAAKMKARRDFALPAEIACQLKLRPPSRRIGQTNRRVPMTRTVTVLCSLIALLAGWGAASAAAQAPRDNPPESYKIAYVLQKTARAARSAQAEGRRDLSAMSNKLVPISAQRLKVVVHAAKPPSAAEEAELLALGSEIDTRLEVPAELGLPPVGQVQIWLPIDRLADLAALDWVVAVTPVAPSTTHQVGGGRIVSEGVAIMRARGAQMDGVTGRGVTVGVMSDGVDSLADAQTRGELPLDVEVLDPGQGDEGTAMLEIVHDMAPGANLVFATGSGDTPSYVTNIPKLYLTNRSYRATAAGWRRGTFAALAGRRRRNSGGGH